MLNKTGFRFISIVENIKIALNLSDSLLFLELNSLIYFVLQTYVKTSNPMMNKIGFRFQSDHKGE